MLSEYKVLVLDDHEFQCAQMSGLLEDAGFTQVDTAHTAEQALTLARTMRTTSSSWISACRAWTACSSSANWRNCA